MSVTMDNKKIQMPFRQCNKRMMILFDRQIQRNGLHSRIYSINGDSYCGEWKNNKKHGHGIMIYHSDQSYYEGEFVDDKRHGYGVLTIRSENSMKKLRRYYVGEWKNDRMDRFGTLYITETDYYEGQFVNGKRCGWGRMFYSNGDM